MKKILYIAILASLTFPLWSQQDEQFTHFMYNKLAFNPAYAGATETGTFTVLSRAQWLGLEGAPMSQFLSFNTPINSKGVGLAGMFSHHTVGASMRLTAEAAYAYRFDLGVGGRMAIGLSSSVRMLRTDFDQLESTQPRELDAAIPTGIQSKYVPNFGVGIYYNNQNFYVGLGAPRILQNNIDLADDSGVISREIRHAYLMGGILTKLGYRLQLQPQVLLKYVEGAPFDAEANVNLIYDNKLYGGLSYRIGGSNERGLGASSGILLGFQITDALLFGMSMDFTLSELRSYSSGSFEGLLRYAIGGRSQGTDILSPRFF